MVFKMNILDENFVVGNIIRYDGKSYKVKSCHTNEKGEYCVNLILLPELEHIEITSTILE